MKNREYKVNRVLEIFANMHKIVIGKPKTPNEMESRELLEELGCLYVEEDDDEPCLNTVKNLKDVVILRYNGEPNKNGHIYDLDSMELPKEVPVSFRFSDKLENHIGVASNIKRGDKYVSANIALNSNGLKFRESLLAGYPAAAGESGNIDGKTVKDYKLRSIGVVTENADPNIKPLSYYDK